MVAGLASDLTGDLDAVLTAQVVSRTRQHLIAGDDLDDPAPVAQVDEGHAPVVTPLRHPPGEGDGLAGVGGTQGAGLVGAELGWSFEGRSHGGCRGAPAAVGRRCADRDSLRTW